MTAVPLCSFIIQRKWCPLICVHNALGLIGRSDELKKPTLEWDHYWVHLSLLAVEQTICTICDWIGVGEWYMFIRFLHEPDYWLNTICTTVKKENKGKRKGNVMCGSPQVWVLPNSSSTPVSISLSPWGVLPCDPNQGRVLVEGTVSRVFDQKICFVRR